MLRMAFVVVLLCIVPLEQAFADLIHVVSIPLPSSLDSGSVIVTVHDNGIGTQSGCIRHDGAFSPCLSGVQGGDNVGTNQVLSFSNDKNFAAVVRVGESGNDPTVVLTDLYLTFVGANGTLTTEYLGPDLTLTAGTGAGASAELFSFQLSGGDLAAIQALGSSVSVSGGMQFASGSTGGTSEALGVIQFGNSNEQIAAVPEPSTLVLLGTGLLAIAIHTNMSGRRRRQAGL